MSVAHSGRSGEWYRKSHRGALAHRLHSWTEGRNGMAMFTDCGKDIKDERPLGSVDAPRIGLGIPRPTGYCRVCAIWR